MARLPGSNISESEIGYMFSSVSGDIILPEWQRGYSWTKEEIDQLFTDIIEEYKSSEERGEVREGMLLGNIILLTFDRENLYLLDGQQRLITITYILKEMVENVDKRYKGVINRIEEFLYSVDEEYNCDYRFKIKREEGKKLVPVEIDEELVKYISKRVKEDLIYDGFDREGGLLNFLLNTVFIVQTYHGINQEESYKRKVFKDILDYFVKFNTRGRPFDVDEKRRAIEFLS